MRSSMIRETGLTTRKRTVVALIGLTILELNKLSFPLCCGYMFHSSRTSSRGQEGLFGKSSDWKKWNIQSMILLAVEVPIVQARDNESCLESQSVIPSLFLSASNTSIESTKDTDAYFASHGTNFEFLRMTNKNVINLPFPRATTEIRRVERKFLDKTRKQMRKKFDIPLAPASSDGVLLGTNESTPREPSTRVSTATVAAFENISRTRVFYNLKDLSWLRRDGFITFGNRTKINTFRMSFDSRRGSNRTNSTSKRTWRRRHARTLEEGIRREKASELSDLLNRAQIDARRPGGRNYIERTLMGLINALAEEVEDIDIDLTTRPRTPIWRKEVQEIRINFSRLGFKPIRMGGSDRYDHKGNQILRKTFVRDKGLLSADEAFDKIDLDKSGTLDKGEMAEALSMISAVETDRNSIKELASDLVQLYDANADGVVDREEYQQMIDDMAQLRPLAEADLGNHAGPLKKVKDSVQTITKGLSTRAAKVATTANANGSAYFDPNEREMGSIVFSGLSLDLRRLIFGVLPILKRILPGGPLVLEPFTVTIRGSFTQEDVMGSFLLDSGLRLLVARAIRVRVRSFRDVVDGAYFFGRQWKMESKTAPVVQVLGLSNVEFSSDKMILTGRARIRTSPDAPVVTNTFKVRTKIGTGNNGQTIGLREPELAFVFECPQAWENQLAAVCATLGLDPPERPEPYYSFFPIYSPFKVNDNAGFDMGEDNQLKKIFIKDGKLRFEMRSVLRPGRFLGSHYLAFTLPIRTFIITMDRVKEGVRVARKNKKIAEREKRLLHQTRGVVDLSYRESPLRAAWFSHRWHGRHRWSMFRPLGFKRKQKSFFARFVEGYTLVEREGEAKNEKLTRGISDWFGRQGKAKWNVTVALPDIDGMNGQS